ncbi:PREDICTED: uncharacterized protein LOC104587226 [Nelumbo nucifera]|uniref:PWWP domain-containing protein n=2 Tax=Nelumbo nucifera TaxID=4432 RepID=A0A822YET1_NELNU|nr:PREDICTED: uncharacterized protein LOC104587226 [Nelumbo nucifera]DAD30922.1 TPA_asm: hypothetical protein HUJ06_009773 [Nelumbo nucifera]
MASPETLAEGCPASEPAKAQTLEDGTVEEASRVSCPSGSTHGETGLELPSEVSVAGTQENGIGVSVSKNEGEGVDGHDVEVTATRAVETEKIFENGTDGDTVVKDETQMLSGSSEMLENGKQVGPTYENGEKNEGDVSCPEVVPTVKEDEKILTEDGLKDGGSLPLIGGDSDKKIEVSGEGISLVVEVHGSAAAVVQDNASVIKEQPLSGCEVKETSNGDQKSEFKENGGLLPDSSVNSGVKLSEVSVSMPVITKNCVITEKEEVKEAVDEEGQMEEGTYSQEHDFSVGDFVWGKIKSHPWWPGQIYDPSDASNYAAKYHRGDRLLVAYFGDGTFAWCHPSQLKPFQEGFEQMSKQSNSKSFLGAVEEAVEEIGRCVELDMICSCVPEASQVGLTRPLVVNAGIKEGVVVPEGRIGELYVTHFEPTQFLECLKCIAQDISLTNILELKVLNCRLSAFCRTKGYRQMPIFHEPKEISNPDDCAGNGIKYKRDINGQAGPQTTGPAEEDWPSSPMGGKTCQTSSHKWPGISEEKLNQRKKQRSMAELLGGEKNVESENCEDDVTEGTLSGKSTSTSQRGKRKKKLENELAEEGQGNTKSAPSSKKLKAARFSPSPAMSEKGDSAENDRGVERAQKGSSSRLRKKSKYLSPPYTNLSTGNKSFLSSTGSETETPEATKVSRTGQFISKDIDQLTGTPPIVRCSYETFQKKHSKECNARSTPGTFSPRTPKKQQVNLIFKESNASSVDMLLELRTVALDVCYLKRNQSSDAIKGFFLIFRSSLYRDGSNYGKYNDQVALRGSQKRKSSEFNSQVTDPPPTEHKAKRKKITKEEASSGKSNSKVEHTAGTSDLKVNHGKEGSDREASSAIALLLTFAPGFSLPSKDDLITMFSRFGALNESETEVLRDSSCARVVFLKSTDAKEAFSSSEKASPFGNAVVNYRLRHLSGASEHDGSSSQYQLLPLTTSGSETKTVASGSRPSSLGEGTPLQFIKQNLELMTSVLEKSGEKLSPEVKSNLEGEIKGLLNKLNSMSGSSSS